ncbi:MAG: M1 family metallopeptidase [Bacteroidetes bacterium]|nr:M1 family metallopeptidase [Bacteroidota bacterium]
MKFYKLISTVCFVLSTLTYYSQPVYFQQEVNYTIDVKLNDKNNTLSAFEKMQYINNSPSALNFIYVHLWPNAYKNHKTDFAKNLLVHKKTSFYYSHAEERGYIDSLNFKVNGTPVKMEYLGDSIDICKLYLNEPLKSLDTITITTPFFVKIPSAKFSRLGHIGQAYFITQWYPKPAVYDAKGWHPIPYLDQGEFYSEFGSFDVNITLPENYVLAATGDRINNPTEDTFINDNVKRTIDRLEKRDFRTNDMKFPESSTKFKTVRFKQFRVHDFAWFADKRFNVVHDQIVLPNTKKIVDTWIYVTNRNFETWASAINAVNESTYFYSYMLGDYPYNNVSAVDGTIMAGGGMEYPNITVIGDMRDSVDLDITIAHEIGHNWFYGILGSNERDEPAMDEGLNSLYELRYTRAKYPSRKLSEYFGMDSTKNILGLNKIPFWRDKETYYFLAARSRSDQKINTPAVDFTNFNYGAIVYAKTAIAFDYLMDYMGEETFNKAMRFYYEQYKFKHPTTIDLEKTLSHFSGTNLDWFFKNLIYKRKYIDYKIESIKTTPSKSYEIKVKNVTRTYAPFNITGYKNGKLVGEVWRTGVDSMGIVGFPVADVDLFKIDGGDRMPDIERGNNYIKVHGHFKKIHPLQLNFITKIENPRKMQLNYIPVVAYNTYNGVMAGVMLHNYNLLEKPFEYSIMPLFGFKSKTPTGTALINYNIYPKSKFQRISIGMQFKSYAYDYLDASNINKLYQTNFNSYALNYYKFAPYLKFDIRPLKATSFLSQNITLSSTFLKTDSGFVSIVKDTLTFGSNNVLSYVNQINYNLQNNRPINPFYLNLNVQQNSAMAKTSATFNYQLDITKKYNFKFRVFAGAFLYGNNNAKGYYRFRTSGYAGYDDYLFNTNFVGRNEANGFPFSQFTQADGGLKVLSYNGQSTQWMTALNIKSPKLFGVLSAFADAAISDNTNNKFLYDAGIAFSIADDIVEVFVPLVYSSEIKNTLELNNIGYWQRIRFTFDIHKLNPRHWVKSVTQ